MSGKKIQSSSPSGAFDSFTFPIADKHTQKHFQSHRNVKTLNFSTSQSNQKFNENQMKFTFNQVFHDIGQ